MPASRLLVRGRRAADSSLPHRFLPSATAGPATSVANMACGACHKDGHNVRSCPKVRQAAAKAGKPPGWVEKAAEVELIHLAGQVLGALIGS